MAGLPQDRGCTGSCEPPPMLAVSSDPTSPPMADLLEWTAFDGSSPPELPDHSAMPGRVMAVLMSDAALDDGWASEVVVGLARSWSSRGARVVLADGCVSRPSLHERFDLPNREGVSDAVQFGASIRRVAVPVDDGAFYLITAGTIASAPGEILSSARWGKLSAGFVEAGVTLVVCGSAAEQPLSMAASTDVVVLCGQDEDALALAGDRAHLVRAVLGPRRDDGDDGVPSDRGPDSRARRVPAWDPPVLEPEMGELDDAESAVEPEPVIELPDTEAAIVASSPARPTARPKSRRSGILLILTLILLAIVMAAVFGLVEIPGLSPGNGSSQVTTDDETLAAFSVPIAPGVPHLTYSVAIGAFQDLAVARQQIDRLSASSGTLVTVVPVWVSGVLFHRVLAGPASDSAEAVELSARLASDAGVDGSGWVVRATPLAYLLGDLTDAKSATDRVADLRSRDVPAYLLAVDHADGSVRFRIYAGAYSDADEATYLGERLAELGLPANSLFDRMGRLPG